MPPKVKKGKKKVVRRKKVTMAPPPPPPLPRLPTGYNRDIPMGGAGGSSNLLANIASMRPPPPATPIQTPDQFSIMREQARQARVIDLVQEEQESVKRYLNKDGTPDMRLKVNREGSIMPTEPAMSIRGRSTTPAPAIKTEQVVSFAELNPETNLKKATKGRKKKILVEEDMEPPPTAPPVLGGAEFEGGAPMFQQGLNLMPSGKLRGMPPDASTSLVGLDPIGEADVPPFAPTGLRDAS